MINTKEEQLVEYKVSNEEIIESIKVLNMVKKLFLIPDIEVMTTKMVAEYYEVDMDAVQKVYQRNKKNISLTGVKFIKNVSELLKSQKSTPLIEKHQGWQKIIFYNSVEIRVPNSGLNVFDLKSIIFIGIQLRSSIISKKFREEIAKSKCVGVLQLLKDNNPNIYNKQFKMHQILNCVFKNIYQVKQQVSCGIYKIDFVINNLAIECDENGHKDRSYKYELKRSKYIESNGYKILRYNPDIEDNIFKLINVILLNLCEKNNLNVGKIINEINANNINT